MATPSPSSRRSPRLTGLPHTPPTKATSSDGGVGGGVISSTGDKTTRTPSPRRKQYQYGKKSPDSDNRVIPFLAVSTPRKSGRRSNANNSSSNKKEEKKMATATDGQIISRRRRRGATISPRLVKLCNYHMCIINTNINMI